MEVTLILLFAISAYLLGSIPTAVWLGKMKYGIDVREHGSNNAGATNTFRVLGKKPGVVVLSIDILKGMLAVFLPQFLSFLITGAEGNQNLIINFQIIAGCSAVLGHVLPVFAGFRGGKGVATSLGVIVAIHPPAAGICIGIFLIVFIGFNYVSLGAIASAISFPVLIGLIFKVDSLPLLVFSIILALAVLISHRKNMGRLLSGTENKMNLFGK